MTRRDVPENWPFRQAARTQRVGGIDWYLIDTGPRDAPAIWLLHGLGASGHSFHRMIAALAQDYRVIVPDLPGQGFSIATNPRRFGLDAMAQDVLALSLALKVPVNVAIGHSAGAAISLRLAEEVPVQAVVGINAALGVFEGAAGVLFPLLAKGLAAAPFAASLFARLSGNARSVDRLLAGTGSVLTPAQRDLYLTLVRKPAHVAGALGMMAQWRLDPLVERLTWASVPTLLLAAEKDNAVPPAVSDQAAARMRKADVLRLPGLGHLAHEEAEDGLTGIILPWLARQLQPAIADDAPKIIGR